MLSLSYDKPGSGVIISKSTKEFQNLIEEEYIKLAERRRNYYLSIYQKMLLVKKDDPILSYFYSLICSNIQSDELLTLSNRFLNSLK